MYNLYLYAESDTSYRRLCWYWIRNYQGIPAVSASYGIVLTLEFRFQSLLQHNAKVYLAARSKGKADKVIASLKEQTGKEPTFLELDLSDLSSVKQCAEEFLRRESELHILFNNA